jgi:type IV pilus assembly protein PilE
MIPGKSNGPGSGFSLIELMVVVAVVAILAAVSYPSYQESVRKAKRAEARAALMQLMQQQERFYSQRNTYSAFSSDSSDVDEMRFKWFLGSSAVASAYEISGQACIGSTLRECVRLQAEPGTPKVDKGYRDPKCGRLSLTSTGVQAADGNDCWR